MDLLYVYICDACDSIHHSKEEILYCDKESCDGLSVRLRFKASVVIGQYLEWENANEWGPLELPENAIIQTMYMGSKSSHDVYSKPWVDADGEIYADRLCLDSNQIFEAEHVGTFESFHSLTI